MGKSKKANVTAVIETKDVDENVVYLYASKQTPTFPSTSPPCLAYETFCRMKKIETKKASAEKRVDKTHGEPKMMLNRKEVVGLHNCMDVAEETFNKADVDLSNEQKADGEAFVKALVESVMFSVYNAVRLRKTQEGTPEFFKRIKKGAQQLLKSKEADERNYVNLSSEELAKVVKDAFSALANYLGRDSGKTYFFGDSPTKYDAIVFGFLAYFYFEQNNELNLKEYFDANERIGTYLSHIKSAFWQDWDECCLQPPPKKEEKVKEVPAPVPADPNPPAPATPNDAPAVNGDKEKMPKIDDDKVETPVAEKPKQPEIAVLPKMVEIDEKKTPEAPIAAVDATTPSAEQQQAPQVIEEVKAE